MTTPSPIDSILSSFSPAQQEAIKALIAQEAAKNVPPPPRELTDAEKVQVHLQTARDALQHAGTTTTIFDRILSVLELIAEKVFAAAVDAAASGVVGAVTGSTANTASESTSTVDTSSASAGSAV